MENKSFYFKWNGFKGFRKKYLLEFINSEIKFEMSESFEHRIQIYTRILILTLIEKKDSGITNESCENLLKKCGLENQQRHIDKIHSILRFIEFMIKDLPLGSTTIPIFTLTTKEHPQFEIKKSDQVIFRINKNIIEDTIIKDNTTAEKYYHTFNLNILSKYAPSNEEIAINSKKIDAEMELNYLNAASVGSFQNFHGNVINSEAIDYDPMRTLGAAELNELDQFRVKVNEFTTDNEDVGFAVLRGTNWCYYMKKLFCIIGRAPVKYGVAFCDKDAPSTINQIQLNKNLGSTSWHVDVDLGQQKKVSKQHALIAYNFQTCSFEIKNLSKKFPVKLNSEVLKYNEEMPLTSKSSISIGNQEFYFLLPF
jgi:hypothetical protein